MPERLPPTVASSEAAAAEEQEEEGVERPRVPVAKGRGVRRVLAWCRSLGPFGRAFAAFLLYAAVSVGLYAHTVLPHFGSYCVGECSSDTKLYIWSLRWMPYALTHGLNPFASKVLWAPAGIDLTWVTIISGPALVMSPVTMLFGPLAADNVLLVAAPALAGWGAYLVCKTATRSYWPSVAGGFVFGFSSYIGHHMHAQLNLLLIFPAPLAAYLVMRRIEGNIGRRMFVGLLALALVGQFSVSSELFATLTLFGAIAFFGALALGSGHLRGRLLSTAKLIGLSYVIVGLLLSPYLFVALRNAPTGPIRPLEKNSVDLLSFVLPRTTTLIGGSTFAHITNKFVGIANDDTAYIGPAFIIMLLMFCWMGWRRRTTWLLVGFVILAAVLSLGPTLHVAGAASIPMPEGLIAKAPLLEHAIPERFPAYLWLALAVIAAIWLAASTRRDRWLRYGVVTLGMVLIVPNLSTPPFHTALSIPSFFTEGTYRRYLQPGEIVLAVPRSPGDELVWQAQTTMYFRLPRGYVGVFPREPGVNFRAVTGASPSQPVNTPSPEAFAQFLQEHQVQAVVVANPVPAEWSTLLLSTVGTTPVSVGGVSIYEA